MNRRRLLLAVATGAAVVGLVLAFAPDAVAVASLPALLPTVLAGLAVLAGLSRAYKWFGRDSDAGSLPEPERGRPAAVPGDEFDALLSQAPSFGVSGGDQRALAVRSDLEDAALSVLTQYRGLSETEARRRLDEGTWTDDELAAELYRCVGDWEKGMLNECENDANEEDYGYGFECVRLTIAGHSYTRYRSSPDLQGSRL